MEALTRGFIMQLGSRAVDLVLPFGRQKRSIEGICPTRSDHGQAWHVNVDHCRRVNPLHEIIACDSLAQ